VVCGSCAARISTRLPCSGLLLYSPCTNSTAQSLVSRQEMTARQSGGPFTSPALPSQGSQTPSPTWGQVQGTRTTPAEEAISALDRLRPAALLGLTWTNMPEAPSHTALGIGEGSACFISALMVYIAQSQVIQDKGFIFTSSSAAATSGKPSYKIILCLMLPVFKTEQRATQAPLGLHFWDGVSVITLHRQGKSAAAQAGGAGPGRYRIAVPSCSWSRCGDALSNSPCPAVAGRVGRAGSECGGPS